MIGSWRSRTDNRSEPNRSRPQVELLEDRVTPAAMNSYEVYALQIANQLRADPAGFAQDLRQLYLGGTYQSPTGLRANDPVWADLRAEINQAEASSSWRSGFTSTGANTFLSVASAMAAQAPLVWDSGLQDGASGHNQWMFTNFYTHSVFTQGQVPPPGESPTYPIPGISRNFNVATGDWFNWLGLGLNRAGENIGYGYNVLPTTLNAYKNGQLTLAGFYQRLVYADLVGYMLEYHNGSSDPWGHLENLVVSRTDPTFRFTLIGHQVRIYENPVESEQGTPQSYFSTSRFGSRANESFSNVLVYQDLNGNNAYDADEGIPAQVSYTTNVVNGAATQGSSTADSSGYSRIGLVATYTSYTVTVSYNGVSFGSQTITRDGSNKNLVFKAVPTNFLTGLRNSVFTFSSDGAWWAADGLTGIARKVAQWSPQQTSEWKFVGTGDFNGDGRTDLIASSFGQWYVGIQGAAGFTSTLWVSWGNYDWVDVKFGDLNGDRKTDIIGRVAGTGSWYAGISTGATLKLKLWGTWAATKTWRDVGLADFNGDRRADLAGRLANGSWGVGVSTGTALRFGLWGAWGAATWVDVKFGDLNRDGRADIIGRVQQTGRWYASLSTGTSFRNAIWGTWTTLVHWSDVSFADVNGDGRMDLVGRIQENGRIYVGLSTGNGMAMSLGTTLEPSASWSITMGDVNGDGKADLVARTGGDWWIGESNGLAFALRSLHQQALDYLFTGVGKLNAAFYNF